MRYLENGVTGITGPMDFKYMKMLRFVLRLLSGWPGEALGEDAFRFEGRPIAYCHVSVGFLYLGLNLWFWKERRHELDFLDMGQMYFVILMTVLATSRAFTLALSEKYKEVAKIFIQKIHLFYFKETSNYAMNVYKKVHWISYMFSIYMNIMLIIAICLFNFIPMYNNYSAGKFKSFANLQNTTYEHAINCLFPWNFETNFNGYVAATLNCWYGTALCASSVSITDLFLCLMVINLWGHFKILIHNLDNFPRPASEMKILDADEEISINIEADMYSEAELKEVSNRLKQSIQYYTLIVDFTNNMSEAFGLALFVYYTFHQATGCLLLLECSQMTAAALSRFLPLTIIMFGELILISVVFETIATMSEKLKDAVYKMPWECMDTKNRKTVQIFLLKVKEPIHVKAGGLLDVGVTTMATVLKTSLSYFAFLRTSEAARSGRSDRNFDHDINGL